MEEFSVKGEQQQDEEEEEKGDKDCIAHSVRPTRRGIKKDVLSVGRGCDAAIELPRRTLACFITLTMLQQQKQGFKQSQFQFRTQLLLPIWYWKLGYYKQSP